MQIGLYIHIPFCASKCHYCDFLSFTGNKSQDAYVEALVKEIKNHGESLNGDYTVKSIFIGGGTPTVLPPLLLDKIGQAIVTHFKLEPNAEWTIEANPGTLTKEKIEVFKNYPITRMSLGLQSTQNHLLKGIGRIHTFEDWHRSMALLRENTNYAINADLMFALPHQTQREFEESLEIVVGYELEHLSVYSLIIEEGTKFGDLYRAGKLAQVEDTLDRTMYHYAQSYLKTKGYEQYEISNWSKPGHASLHNSLYWKREPYIGIGLGAHSLFNEVRYYNEKNLQNYIKADGVIEHIRHEEGKVTTEMAMEEYMFLGLRMLEGINIKDFEKTFKCSVWEVYKKQLEKWIKYDVLVKDKDNIRLTKYGLDVCNEVFISFL